MDCEIDKEAIRFINFMGLKIDYLSLVKYNFCTDIYECSL